MATKAEAQQKYSRSIKGVITNIYKQCVQHSKKRGHGGPSFSKVELTAWLNSSIEFQTLYRAWVYCNYYSRVKPSLDRLDNRRGYSFDNVRVCSWAENNIKQ